jgi:hypothetical protein
MLKRAISTTCYAEEYTRKGRNKMVSNETVWDSAVEITNTINKLVLALEQQNRILQRILEALCAK